VAAQLDIRSGDRYGPPAAASGCFSALIRSLCLGYTVRHTIDTDVDSFWKLFFDPELARALLKSIGNAATFEVSGERVDDQGMHHRRIDCTSNTELPDFVKKFVGDGSYTELGRFDPTLKKYNAQCIPKLGADKFQTTFEISTSPLDNGARCERLTTVENKVKVFGIGGMIESLLERTQREADQKSADFINEWIRSRSSHSAG
jgi:hypothetical protein